MKYFSKILILLMLICALNALSACGKISEPLPYPDSGYPHKYPRY